MCWRVESGQRTPLAGHIDTYYDQRTGRPTAQRAYHIQRRVSAPEHDAKCGRESIRHGDARSAYRAERVLRFSLRTLHILFHKPYNFHFPTFLSPVTRDRNTRAPKRARLRD